MKKERTALVNRDTSWLSFNDRVLQEANDASVPLLERLKFLGIYSNNRDEFFRVRVATLMRMVKMGGAKTKELLNGVNPEELLDQIQHIIINQQERFDDIYQNILKELELQGVFIINEKQLTPEHGEYVKTYFHEEVLPALVPIMMENTKKFPYLKDHSLYLLVTMYKKEKGEKAKHALVEVPSGTLSRFLVLPKENKYVILLEDVIRYCLDDLFFNFDYSSINAYIIKLTRDAELDIEQDVTKSIVKKVAESIKRRRTGQPVRLTYDEEMPPETLAYLMKRVRLSKDDLPIPGGRYHNFVDFMRFPALKKSELKYSKHIPLSHLELKPKTSLLKIIKQKDILLSFPYQSYHYIIDVLREASIDPKVRSIQITLYRASKNSNIVNALINAIKNGKQVTAVVELQARFDEEANINWANKLNEEGAKIIYGVPGLKAHTKLFLITRQEHGKAVQYAHIGTGNFNEDTALVYCDHSLLTCDIRITNEVARMFSFYTDNYKTGTYKHLLVSPFFMRKSLLQLIAHETGQAKKGKQAWIFLKLNSLTDPEMIRELYAAGKAGVKIRLIIRSICSLIPGKDGLSENIQAISIIDRYLEHARIYSFCNGGKEKYFISSADWMQRNLDFRSEVAVPIYDLEIQQQLKDLLEIQWSDNVKARVIDEQQLNTYNHRTGKKVRSQEATYHYFRNLTTVDKAIASTPVST